MFSRPLAFATIPKACGFEAATRFPSILLGGSLIPIVVYVFSQPLAFATIPKACGFEAATRRVPFVALLTSGGSLIPIVVIGMGMALPWLNTYIVVYRDGDGFSLAKHVLRRDDISNRSV